MQTKALTDDIRYLKGVGEKRANTLAKLGIKTVGDLLKLYPRTYEDWSAYTPIASVFPGEKACVKVTCLYPVEQVRTKSRLPVFTTVVNDGTATMRVTIFGSKYQAEKLQAGNEYLLMGTIKHSTYGKEMVSPKIEPFTGNCAVKPVYPLTAGITETVLSKCVKCALEQYGDLLEEPLPQGLLETYGLMGIREAVTNVHFPSDKEKLARAKERLAFEELLYLQIGLLRVKGRNSANTSPVTKVDYTGEFINSLPFALTGAQQKVVEECARDLADSKPMNRLVQGDVGSGKTAVAQALMYSMAKNGWQCAMMAPTEILARQHYENTCRAFEGTDVTVTLLVGSMSAATKREAKKQVAEGTAKIVIGTHALVQKDVQFHNLGLIVTDEQHRFGVSQRSTLADKGENTNVLVMSATPIPRTLALIIYGDLDISIIDELPPGRQEVKTYCVDSNYQQRINAFLEKELSAGRQAYVVCPMVDENESEDILAATEYSKKLQVQFPHHKVGLLHGKLKNSEKDEIMRQFAEGEISLLVATTVVEVGIDVPNATVMVVENAERFGLSTLHQLRGRTGRGKYQSYCILVTDNTGADTKERMSTLCATTDGFKIAAADLKLRGPGEFIGARQHGEIDLRIARLMEDTATLSSTQEAAKLIMSADPELKSVKYAGIKRETEKLFEGISTNIFN